MLFLPRPSLQQGVPGAHGNSGPGQGAGALTAGARGGRGAGGEISRY